MTRPKAACRNGWRANVVMAQRLAWGARLLDPLWRRQRGDLGRRCRTGQRQSARDRLVRDGDPSELDALAAAGVMGIRLNYVHGGVLSWAGAKALAWRWPRGGCTFRCCCIPIST